MTLPAKLTNAIKSMKKGLYSETRVIAGPTKIRQTQDKTKGTKHWIYLTWSRSDLKENGNHFMTWQAY